MRSTGTHSVCQIYMHANYRKLNDGSQNSSKYHKKDGTAVRAILKRELVQINARKRKAPK